MVLTNQSITVLTTLLIIPLKGLIGVIPLIGLVGVIPLISRVPSTVMIG